VALYDDLGGASAIVAALDSFYPKVLADPKLSPFFAGVDTDKLKIHVGAFFAMATGGPAGYGCTRTCRIPKCRASCRSY